MTTSQVCRLNLCLGLSLLLAGCPKSPERGRDAADDSAEAGDTGDVPDSGAPNAGEAGSGPPLGDIGTTCEVNADCASGSCVDGVCCSSSMCGACQSCGVPDSPGICAPLPPFALDPTSGCAAPNGCDGAGHCLAGNGQRCATGGECVSGFCTDGFCCGSACTDQCFSCGLAGLEGTCEPLDGVQDLVASAACAGTNVCVVTPAGAPACRAQDGQICVKDEDCASGRCRTYFLDGDGDGYGSINNTIARCDANPNPPRGYVAVGGDCCDFDHAANPGIAKTSYFATPDACGNFDYDCDGLLEKQHLTGTCAGFSSGATPDCGKDCNSVFGTRFVTKLFTQACR